MPVKNKGMLKILFGIFFPAGRSWSCTFLNWSRLVLEMYSFLTLEFTLL